ncbi:MAG TPA: DinB family protein [Acidobacteria bacterium]|nr:DinB family protein [Acidobacteriota bacterium]
MKKTLHRNLSLVLALALAGAVARPALADHHTEGQGGGSAIKAEILGQINDAEKKLLQLAEATPEEKFGWRPTDKVRSTGEVFLHVAGGNYFLPTLWGVKPPEGVDMQGMDKMAGDKAKVIEALKKSFDHVRQVVGATADADLDKPIKLFSGDGTVREGILLIATHGHEHLGQAIAYARMSGITPPWSS